MTQERDAHRNDGQGAVPGRAAGRAAECDSPTPEPFLPRTAGQRALAVVVSVFLVVVAVELIRQFPALSRTFGLSPQTGRQMGSHHSRAMIERDGRRLLWARDARDGEEAEWFDVTGSKIDPERFQYGIGKDSIRSIDSPQFVAADDPRLQEADIDDDTRIVGFVHEGDARAYPLYILDRHELVNDTVGGKPVTVGW